MDNTQVLIWSPLVLSNWHKYILIVSLHNHCDGAPFYSQVYMHTCMLTCIYIYIYIYIYAEAFTVSYTTEADTVHAHKIVTYIHTCIRKYARIYACTHVHIYTRIRTYQTLVHAYIRILANKQAHAYMHPHTYIQKHTYTHACMKTVSVFIPVSHTDPLGDPCGLLV